VKQVSESGLIEIFDSQGGHGNFWNSSDI